MENKFTNIKERIVQFANDLDISKEAFFRSIGMSSANFRGKAKETPLNSNAIVNIITKYPTINLKWLLLGEEKLKENYAEESSLEYFKSSDDCKEKDELIKILQKQIEDLKADKEDLKKLLGLKK